jgi:hypothetical protein
MTTGRKLIFDNLIAALKSIKIADGYKLTAQTVERYVMGWDEIPHENSAGAPLTPWFGAALIGGAEVIDHHVRGLLHVTMPFIVMGYVASEFSGDFTEDWRGDRESELFDDITAAIMADVTRGGNAVTTKITEQWADTGLPVKDAVERGRNIAGVVVRGQIKYYRTPGHS